MQQTERLSNLDVLRELAALAKPGHRGWERVQIKYMGTAYHVIYERDSPEHLQAVSDVGGVEQQTSQVCYSNCPLRDERATYLEVSQV